MRYIGCLMGLVLLAGCAAPTTSVRMLVPAEHNEVTQYRRISVLPFQGRYGVAIASELEAELVAIYINNEPFFTVVERVRLQHAMDELALGQTGMLDDKTIVKVGQMVGAEAIYTGALLDRGVGQERYTETRQECTQHKNPDKLFSKCLAWKDVTVYCQKKTATFHFSPKVIVVATGQVVYGNNIQESSEASHCEDNNSAITSDEVLLAQAKQAAFQRFIKDVAPTYVDQQLVLMDDVQGMTPAAAEKLRAGIAFAKEQRMDRACQLWQQALPLNGGGNALSILYDLGVCAETQSDYANALSYFNRADQQLQKPDKTVSDALARIRLKMQQKEQLQLQL